jgi:citrate lyase subunit beta/citryl-CoA lyase
MNVPRRLRRSCLAVPGSSERMIEKAATLEVDHVFFDLEDATAPAEKPGARAKVVEALATLDFGRKTLAVRINDVRTRWAYADVIEVVSGAGARLDCVMIPKAESAADVHFVATLLRGLELDLGFDRPLGIEVLIETARGAVNIREISRASERIEAIIFGPGDYALDLGVPRFRIGTPDPDYPGHQWHWVMSEVANHARAVGAQAIDGPVVDFADEEGYRALARRAKALGFEGKWCVHPNQIPWATETFSISPDEVARARSLLEAYGRAREEGRGAAVFDGIMVDDATRKMAELVLARAVAAEPT